MSFTYIHHCPSSYVIKIHVLLFYFHLILLYAGQVVIENEMMMMSPRHDDEEDGMRMVQMSVATVEGRTRTDKT